MDDVDHAQAQADRQTEAILAGIRARNAATPASERPALRICITCPDPIDGRRLAANPGAIRCTGCQAEVEGSTARCRLRGVAA